MEQIWQLVLGSDMLVRELGRMAAVRYPRRKRIVVVCAAGTARPPPPERTGPAHCCVRGLALHAGAYLPSLSPPAQQTDSRALSPHCQPLLRRAAGRAAARAAPRPLLLRVRRAELVPRPARGPAAPPRTARRLAPPPLGRPRGRGERGVRLGGATAAVVSPRRLGLHELVPSRRRASGGRHGRSGGLAEARGAGDFTGRTGLAAQGFGAGRGFLRRQGPLASRWLPPRPHPAPSFGLPPALESSRPSLPPSFPPSLPPPSPRRGPHRHHALPLAQAEAVEALVAAGADLSLRTRLEWTKSVYRVLKRESEETRISKRAMARGGAPRA